MHLVEWISSTMRQVLILAVCVLCILTAKAEDDYPTIVRYLGENGHFIISPSDVAKVQAYMKANGYQHVSDIPKGSFATADPAAQPSATEAVSPTRLQTAGTATESASGPMVTRIVVPSATPMPASKGEPGLLLLIIALYCLPVLIAIERRHRQIVPIGIVNVAFGWTVVGWIVCLAWAFARGKEAS